MSHLRQILKSATAAPTAARDAIAMILAEELTLPSRTLYLIAPWVSNIVIFDNTIAQFDGLNPEWGRRDIRLIDVLVMAAGNHTRLVCAVRPDSHNHFFQTKLFSALDDAGLRERCAWSVHENLHTKGLLTERAFLSGSMNFTANGITLNDEVIQISFNRQHIAQAELEFRSYDVA